MKYQKNLFIIKLAIILFLAAIIFPMRGVYAAEDKVLNIWTWGIYCPDFATKPFEKKYGIKVNCTFYHGNEELWSKIQAGHKGVDIIQPSNHMIKRFAKAGLLLPIEISKIPNYKGISEDFKRANYNTIDGKQYSVPYTFGIMGIGYRTDLIKKIPTSWGALWDKKYKRRIAFSRNPVDACFAVAIYLGMDISKLDEDTDAKLALIKEKMRKQNPLLLKRIGSLEEMKNLLATGEIWITSADDGMIHKMQLDGLPVEFVVPKEGAAAWIDQFCILSDAPHKDAAYKWINFMLSPEIASQMIKKMGYMVVNAKASSALPKKMAEIMTYTGEELKHVVPYPTLKPKTSEKLIKAYQDVRGK